MTAHKFYVAGIGLVILLLLPIVSKYYGIDFSAQTQFVIQAIISVLTAAGVYGVPNKSKDDE